MSSRRRLIATSEGLPLELDFGRSNYSTFAINRTSTSQNNYWVSVLSNQTKSSTSTGLRSALAALLVAILGVLLLITYSSIPAEVEESIPVETWYRNHYNPKGRDSGAANVKNRNLLIVQLSSTQTHPWSEATSRPNRAYARRWRYDFLLHNSDDSALCLHQSQVLWEIYQRQLQDQNSASEWYDSMLFLSPDAIISNMDFDIATLLPRENLATLASNEKLSMLNVRHKNFLTLAELWLQSCDLTASVESVEGISTILDPSVAGFLEPRLVKFLVDESAGAVTTLHTTADAVCYRYYPRCDVVM